MFNRDNKFLLMAIKNVKGLFQACLYEQEHSSGQKQLGDKTVEDVFIAEMAKKPNLFGKPAEFSVKG